MEKLLAKIRRELKENASEKTRKSGERFFKEEIKLYGVKTAVVSQVCKKYFKKIQEKDKKDIFALCEKLWQSGYMEESFIACNWSYFVRKNYEEKDFFDF